jgi:hypothetical protein
MQLTAHFSDTELAVAGCEARLLDNATYICDQLLEPIRLNFGPVRVDDGYRDPTHNARVGGKPDSYHLFDFGRSAADIRVNGQTLQYVFDWIRLRSGLPFDKVILEYSENIPACIHLQIDSKSQPRRLAYTGSTGAGTEYLPAAVN